MLMTTHVKETKAFKPTQRDGVVLRGQGTPRGDTQMKE